MQQAKELSRVRGKIARHVIAFYKEHVLSGNYTFRGNELTDYVFSREPIAFESPMRILRNLKTDGLLNYEVVNRAQSLYKFTGFDYDSLSKLCGDNFGGGA